MLRFFFQICRWSHTPFPIWKHIQKMSSVGKKEAAIIIIILRFQNENSHKNAMNTIWTVMSHRRLNKIAYVLFVCVNFTWAGGFMHAKCDNTVCSPHLPCWACFDLTVVVCMCMCVYVAVVEWVCALRWFSRLKLRMKRKYFASFYSGSLDITQTRIQRMKNGKKTKNRNSTKNQETFFGLS